MLAICALPQERALTLLLALCVAPQMLTAGLERWDETHKAVRAYPPTHKETKALSD